MHLEFQQLAKIRAREGLNQVAEKIAMILGKLEIRGANRIIDRPAILAQSDIDTGRMQSYQEHVRIKRIMKSQHKSWK